MLAQAVFGISNSGVNLAIDLLILFLVVVWLALVYWTYADARRRISDPMLIGCATAASLFPFVGTLVYMIVRPPEYLDDVRERLMREPGVREVRAVRVRRSGPRLLGDARVAARRMLSVEASQALRNDVREAVAGSHPNLELDLVIEADEVAANLVERVHAAAARHGAVSDLHNVTVEKEEDGTIHVTLHAKLPGEISLDDAAGTSGDLERRLRAELPEISRVDVHLEPLEPDLVSGADVTGRREDLARRVRALVAAHPEVRACRDVELSSRGSHIVAHVVAEIDGEVTLEHAHAVETDLEESLRQAVPELSGVVARVAP